MISSCVGVYLLFFVATGCRIFEAGLCIRQIWLGIVLVMGTCAYISDYQHAGLSMRFVTFLTVVALGQSAIVFVRSEENPEKILQQFLILLLALLAVGVFWQSDKGSSFKYHGQVRWSGLWNNPNVYGLLMGVGTVVSCGLLVRHVSEATRAEQPKVKNPVAICGMPLAVGGLLLISMIMCLGLVKSGSRGAWLAALCAFLYLGFVLQKELSRHAGSPASWIRPVKHVPSPVVPADGDLLPPPMSPDCGDKLRESAFQRSVFAWAIISCSVASLAFWPLQHAESHTARRVVSAGNWNDFSMRNRLGAWEGSLQMMADRPWRGFGWNRTWQAYGSYFNDAKIEDASAVQTNAYFVLGTTLGLPALLCFVIYILMVLQSNTEPRSLEYDGTAPALKIGALKWAGVVCRAGAIVLIVGFWFDGGLFDISTAALFWVLLELGIPVRSPLPRLAGGGRQFGL
jgi:hypothetical protein